MYDDVVLTNDVLVVLCCAVLARTLTKQMLIYTANMVRSPH